MSMRQAIIDFPKQFEFDPVIERAGELRQMPAVIVSGMGGSHLAADLLKSARPSLNLFIHRDYGLPPMQEAYFKNCLFIASSYSGNTEEVLDGLGEAEKKGMTVAALSVGGQLEKLAREQNLPYVKLPDTSIQPRSALGFSLLALVKLMGLEQELTELHALSHALDAGKAEQQGIALSEQLSGHIPVVYASGRNEAVAYNWKIKCNEIGKIPAFYNVFPELNHNEMTGFSAEGGSASGGDAPVGTRALIEKFHFIFLRDSEDDPHIIKRMDICRDLYMQRGVPVTDVMLEGSTRWERIFNSLLVADWFSFYTGTSYGVETEQVPMVEEFKKAMQ